MSWVDEPLFLNRGAIATPKSRPPRTWTTGLSVLYLSYTESIDAGGPRARAHFTYTHVVCTHDCVPGTERGPRPPYTQQSRTKTNPPSSRPPLTQSEVLEQFLVFE